MSDRIGVLLTKHFFQEDIDYLSSNVLENVSFIVPSEFTTEAIADAVKNDVNVLFGPHIAKSILDNGKSLQLLQVPWTGVEALGFELLRKYDIAVCNSHSNATVTAEYAVALMMAIAKKVPFHDRQLRLGKWCRPKRGIDDSFMPPVSINGKTIGFIGYGAIARNIVQFLSGFSVEFIAIAAHDYLTPPAPLKFIGGSSSIEFVVSNSDFLFVTLPLTSKTRGLLRKDLLTKTRPSSYLINISRGEIIDEDDLYFVLENKIIAGAAIDAWYNYPTPDCPDVLPSKKNRFHELDNLVLSPHRAGFASGSLPHLDDAIENINRLATGKPLINRVNLEEGY